MNKIKALILDYGGVISKPQNSENVNNILRILNQDLDDFMTVYRGERENYDNGKFSGEEYWMEIYRHFGMAYNKSEIERLIQEDIKSWTYINEAMINFIKEIRGKVCKLSILSNMTRDTSEYMKRHFQWLGIFDELIYSWELGINKPDQRIYEACLSRLEIPSHECLFVDDTLENIDGAERVGINGIHFKSFLEFREELDRLYDLSR